MSTTLSFSVCLAATACMKGTKKFKPALNFLEYLPKVSTIHISCCGTILIDLKIVIKTKTKKINMKFNIFPPYFTLSTMAILPLNSLIITILPDIFSLLKNEDTVTDSLAFLSLIIERNSAFIKFYRNVGIIDYIFILMKDPNLYSNLNLIKILIKLIESNDTGFKDIIDLDLIDKVNYMISKDNLEEITVYTEYVIEMLFDLLFKLKYFITSINLS